MTPPLLFELVSTGEIATVVLTQGKVAMVDAADLPIIEPYSWCAAQVRPDHWYPVGSRQGSSIRMHRLLLGVVDNRWVDHRDGDGLNNRRSNLRISDRTGNNRNRRAMGTTSQYIGVTRKKGRTPTENPKWEVHIYLNGVGTYVGSYVEELDAARAYDAVAFTRDPEFARLNFPENYR